MMKLVQYIYNLFLFVYAICIAFTVGHPPRGESHNIDVSPLRTRAVGLKFQAENLTRQILEDCHLYFDQSTTDFLDRYNFISFDGSEFVAPMSHEKVKTHYTRLNEYEHYVNVIGTIEPFVCRFSILTRQLLQEYHRYIISLKTSIVEALRYAGYMEELPEETVVTNRWFTWEGVSLESLCHQAYVVVRCDGIKLFSKLQDAYRQM